MNNTARPFKRWKRAWASQARVVYATAKVRCVDVNKAGGEGCRSWSGSYHRAAPSNPAFARERYQQDRSGCWWWCGEAAAWCGWRRCKAAQEQSTLCSPRAPGWGMVSRCGLRSRWQRALALADGTGEALLRPVAAREPEGLRSELGSCFGLAAARQKPLAGVAAAEPRAAVITAASGLEVPGLAACFSR